MADRACTVRRVLEIEEEYGESIEAVLRGFASDGEAITTTARILGWHPKSLRRYMTRHGLDIEFKRGSDSNGFKNKSRPPRTIPAAMFEKNPIYRWVEIDGVRDTLAGHARRLGIPQATVYGRIYRGGLSVTEALKKQHRPRVVPGNSRHKWRQHVHQ